MLFNSFAFLIFLPLVFICYWIFLNKYLELQNLFLLIASYFFYGFWSWKFLIILILSTFLDYCYGFLVLSNDKKKAKLFLWLSMINNLGILCVFKYYNFFILQFKQVFSLLGIKIDPILLNIALPIGISFYTFHGMSYIIDIYYNRQKPIKNFVNYAVFVSFFPLLVAGPIERANHLIPQIQIKRKFNYTQAIEGSRLILWGMFKKVVIADSLAIFVDDIYNNYQSHNAYTLILGSIAFSFQIYGDFSGYSDIAIGTAKLFGFELLSNFKFPYFSRNVGEFWRRWHISLSTWFRDYLYIPLGGSKKGIAKSVRNIFIIFIISGFWHGASWNFIVWGVIHALGFLPIFFQNKNRRYLSDIVAKEQYFPSFKELYQMVITFLFVTFAWIFFRSNDINDAINYLKRIYFSINLQPNQFMQLPKGLSIFIFVIPLIIGDWLLRKNERSLIFPNNYFIRYSLYYILALSIYIKFNNNQSFIYFQF
jgi:alginate O-acetyltransferase complex protein AlgI